MPSDTVYRVVRQYSKGPVPPGDMKKLQEIADDYRDVKNYVYQRYGGITSLHKLYPGYTVQNEMTESGLRARLGLPSVYFYRAVFEALGDIKTQWGKLRTDILSWIKTGENLTPKERHYLRFVIKVADCFNAVLTECPVVLPQALQAKYEAAAADVDTDRMNRYLCRQVRKRIQKPHTEKAEGFAATGQAYRYGDHGIFIATKEKRKRIFIPLTDGNKYEKQIYIKLKPDKGGIEIFVPLEVKIKRHKDYDGVIGISPGVWQMYTVDNGHVYGEAFGAYHQEMADYMRSSNSAYQKEKRGSPGREKYKNRKRRYEARLESYINQEINRMLKEEKPKTVYIPKLPQISKAGVNRKINYSITVWRKGYIQSRLRQKCRENSIRVVAVTGKGISTECSRCGEQGGYVKNVFRCPSCGYEAGKKVNAAINVKKRGLTGEKTGMEQPEP